MQVPTSLALFVLAALAATTTLPGADAFVMLRSAAQCKAASVSAGGAISSCISQFGDVRLSCGTACRGGEESITWNQQGELG